MSKPNCTNPRAHRPRTLSDTGAGILADYSGNFPVFHVHCLKCCGDFGPYRTLTAAQAVGRECSECAVLLVEEQAKASLIRRDERNISASLGRRFRF